MTSSLTASDSGDQAAVANKPELEDRASEVAWVLAELAPDLPEQTAHDLKRLLSRSLTSPSLSERREARLGLLIDLAREGQGEVPSVATYNERRARRNEQGESWPSHSTLIRAYGGHWLSAVRAAMRLVSAQARGVAEREHRTTKVAAYSATEVIEAVSQCWQDLGLDPSGGGPSHGEYLEWANLARTGARLAGQPLPRLPSRDAVRRHFPKWELVIERCRDRRASLERVGRE
jgi:hypothetical protein